MSTATKVVETIDELEGFLRLAVHLLYPELEKTGQVNVHRVSSYSAGVTVLGSLAVRGSNHYYWIEETRGDIVSRLLQNLADWRV